MNRDLAIIDGDHIVFRCAVSAENDPAEIACVRADLLMHRILYALNDPEYEFYIGGEDNFRYKIYPEYKANRKGKAEPKHLQAVREHMILHWNAKIVNGMEVDDMCGIRMTEEMNANMYA